ncbi:MAG TPA: chloride channel protein [Polyangiales bacterium]|jgi:CIC family chloride channel protein|nr:chloride channel protein [Polyangiales bacterium]
MNPSELANADAQLGDFTTTARVVPISLLAIVIGGIGGLLASALLTLINLFTQLFFFQRLSIEPGSPANNTLGGWAVIVPVIGALIIGVMARYGSERIRGHGIPEALESILMRGSRVEPRVALLKPVSSAISIGSGGPFGAEGPIIMTGGAVGSIVAQLFHFSSAERKTLLVAGAAAGMSATFCAPMASVVLAVELLLFELKPRSLVPVALASAAAALVRHYLLGPGPLFPVPVHSSFPGPSGLLGCVLIGVLAGALSLLITRSVYAAEDAFKKLPLHWMWWPAIGAIVVGLGGLVEPRALGVGYENIAALLRDAIPMREIVLLAVVKWVIWAVYLGSGTSGGVLAPLLMIGCALGGIAAPFLPNEGAGFWPLIAMAAILGGTMRAPLTGVVFATELTGDHGSVLPLLVAAVVAHGFTVLTVRRSILTEKIARRGFHVTREYAIDPFEVLFVRDVMHSSVVVLPASAGAGVVAALLASHAGRLEPLYPLVDADQKFVGIVKRSELEGWVQRKAAGPLSDLASESPTTAYDDEPLGIVLNRMANTGETRLPVLARESPGRLAGMLTLAHTLKAKRRHLEDETRRERARAVDLLVPAAFRRNKRRAAAPS